MRNDKKAISASFQSKIIANLYQHIDMIYELLPENRGEAETIMQHIQALVRDGRLKASEVYRRMERPIYFSENEFHEFTRRPPLIAKIARVGEYRLFHAYLLLKYGAPLSENLLNKSDILIFHLPVPTEYIAKNKSIHRIGKQDALAIKQKFYDVYGAQYELLGDILQEKEQEILSHLALAHFPFQNPIWIEHLNQYFYMNRFNRIQFPDHNIQFLIDHEMNIESLIDTVMMNLWDELSLPNFASGSSALIHMARYLLDHGARLLHVLPGFLNEVDLLLGSHAKRLATVYQKDFYQQTLVDIQALQCQLREQVFTGKQAMHDEGKFSHFQLGINRLTRKF